MIEAIGRYSSAVRRLASSKTVAPLKGEEMKEYLKSETNLRVAATDCNIDKQMLILCIGIALLLICLLSYSGCSSSADANNSSDNKIYTTTTSYGYTANSSSSTALVSRLLNPQSAFVTNGEIISLYQGIIPNNIPNDIVETSTGSGTSLIYKNVTVPTLTIYLPQPDIATGAAVIYCPGGGYSEVQYGCGITIASYLNKKGIAVFILKYRLPSDSTMKDKTIGPLQDAQQAIKIVRQRAKEWGIDPGKVGIMGYSAGGHLASTAGTHFDKTFIPNQENINLRPDYMILLSSVISMDKEVTHSGSRECLLGETPGDDLVELFSNETQITEKTPPTWLIHAEDDSTVPVENSILFYDGLADENIPSEMDLYSYGSHCLVWNISADEWIDPLSDWLESIGIIP
jgi:acetyl esterase/lipase